MHNINPPNQIQHIQPLNISPTKSNKKLHRLSAVAKLHLDEGVTAKVKYEEVNDLTTIAASINLDSKGDISASVEYKREW